MNAKAKIVDFFCMCFSNTEKVFIYNFSSHTLARINACGEKCLSTGGSEDTLL